MKIIHRDGTVSVCPEQEQISVLRHTAAHILAQAVKRLYPQARFAFGPATEQGFYYDVDLGETKLTEAELPAIEEEMRRIVRENYPIKPFVLSRDDALALMRERGEDYKCEHIASLDEETFSFFRQGEYIDLCRGPHLTYTNALKVFRLIGVSGAYWKNDASRPMLTRITGTAFVGQEEMDAYDYILVNETVDKAVEDLHNLIQSQHMKASGNQELIKKMKEELHMIVGK